MSVTSRTRRRVLGTVAAATLLTLVGAAAASAAPGVGAAGIGDPYYPDYGNGGYDVGHYAIDVGYTPATGRLTGRTTLHANATQPLRRFNLDLLLPASSVLVDGRPAAFGRSGNGHELVVTPAVPIRQGETMLVEVAYAGRPAEVSDDGVSPWTRTSDGAIAVGRPQIAAWWYPSNDHPRDKATFDIAITVPRGVEAISNGRLVGKTEVGSQDRWSWRSSQPMGTYLAFLAIGQFDVTSGTTAAGLPWLNAVAAGVGPAGAHAAAGLARTPAVVEWLERQWGPYPFDAIGGVATRNGLFESAEATQTRPVYGLAASSTDNAVRDVVQQMAYQWFGNSVSVTNWRDIWLSEGLAGYSMWRWGETHYSWAGNTLLHDLYQEYSASDGDFWGLATGDPGATNQLAWQMSVRAQMTVQALRNRVGSPAFFQIMRTWVAQHRHGNADTGQFIRLAERLSGQQLDEFFQAWLYAPARPAQTRANGLDPEWGHWDRAARSAEVEQIISLTLRSRNVTTRR